MIVHRKFHGSREALTCRCPSSTRNIHADPRQPFIIGIDAGGMPQRIELMIVAVTWNYERFRVSLAQ